MTTQTHSRTITPFLTFEGNAESAMDFYTSVFPNSEVLSLTRYGEDEAGDDGTIQQAVFTLDGEPFMCIDSTVEHEWTITPAVSLYVNCETEAEIDELFAELSNGGEVFIPLESYPFSEKYAWIADQFGVSWQLSLDASEERTEDDA
ncbi:hypothetical protein C2R22_21095 (plasmid) [Salinigranum rubrum]|uniref:PhnB-like domain-containing protein n=1 Tax=Salinigranum rubrum TaxID=755307 RepID=A0A2I8VQC5_9EURY|nr:VOC family protein [Salinigranum rubrum]AUV84096.1 hypothetical protein C2R22_21095 [Salinigranum rubrum]